MAGRVSMDDRSLRPTPLQTSSVQRPTTAPHSGTPTTKRVVTPQLAEARQSSGSQKASHQPASRSGHQRFVLNDPVAFRYLEEDPSTTVLERRSTLEGYECYIVEQWTTSRTHPTFVITTYTGDPSHVIVVGVLSVPTDEASWSPRLRVYFKALNQYHARRRDTSLGILMVTNLTAFPSSLSVIPVPGGDLKKHRYDFFVNENLKRLGCSGRVGLTLTPPTGATIAKFHQLYRTSDKNEIYKSVVELVKLCQSALMLFNKLDIDYADGLLCDVTERAINDWWIEIGSEYYSIEPHDGILGPTTVAALLGLLAGARNRLHAVSAPVSKDAFDVDAMKRGVGAFQKQQRITRSRRLERSTLDRLHKATSKAASSESWTVPRVVKSTMAELSGKGGEMVMDAVGRRDRAGIAEIETTDLDRFVQLAYGERCKWLWYGKPLKRAKPAEDVRLGNDAGNGLVFRPDEHGGFTWTGRKSTVDGMPVPARRQYDDLASPIAQEDDTTDEDEQKRGLFKRATGLKHEAKSGLGKFKGVVGIKSHQQKPSQSHEESPKSPVEGTHTRQQRPSITRSHTSPASSIGSIGSPMQERNQSALTWDPEPAARVPSTIEEASLVSRQSVAETADGMDELPDMDDSKTLKSDHASTAPSETRRPSITESYYHGIDLDEALPTGPETDQDVDMTLRRTSSYSQCITTHHNPAADAYYPRHLSFSLAEDSVLTWRSLVQHLESESDDEPLVAQMAQQQLHAKTAINLRIALATVSSDTADWTTSQIKQLRELLPLAEQNAEQLAQMYRPHLDNLQSLQSTTETMLRVEREELTEGGKELETLASKLEYEINGLKDRVDEVDTNVRDFERSVARVEERVTELEKDEQGKGWSCAVHILIASSALPARAFQPANMNGHSQVSSIYSNSITTRPSTAASTHSTQQQSYRPTYLDYRGTNTSTRPSTQSSDLANALPTQAAPQAPEPVPVVANSILVLAIARVPCPELKKYVQTALSQAKDISAVVLLGLGTQEQALKPFKVEMYALAGSMGRSLDVQLVLLHSWVEGDVQLAVQQVVGQGAASNGSAAIQDGTADKKLRGVICDMDTDGLAGVDMLELETAELEDEWKRSVGFVHVVARNTVPLLRIAGQGDLLPTSSLPTAFFATALDVHRSVDGRAVGALIQNMHTSKLNQSVTFGSAEHLLVPDPEPTPMPEVQKLSLAPTQGYNDGANDIQDGEESPTKLWAAASSMGYF